MAHEQFFKLYIIVQLIRTVLILYERSDICPVLLTLYVPETQLAEFANSVNLDEVAHKEPPYQDLHCLPSSL